MHDKGLMLMILRCARVRPRAFGCRPGQPFWSWFFRWPVVRAPESGGTTVSKLAQTTALRRATVAESWIDASDPRLRGSERDNACWWTAFGDPTLNQLVAEASQQNLTLKMAGCRILQARAERGIAEGNLFPQQQR